LARAEEADSDLTTDLSDPWVTAKIESKYFLDAEVKGRKIDVSTDNGIVTLAGEVSSAAEKRQAIALARSTDGVKEVRDQLRVMVAGSTDPELRTEAGRPAGARTDHDNSTTAAVVPNDDWIETRIQAKFFLEDDLKAEEISISSDEGTVTLEGAVDSPDAKETAEDIARETHGVDVVVNRIAVSAQAQSAR
jgi:hyperosmotically inducible protein